MTEGRDFVGYGQAPPGLAWPGGARLAVNLVINYEEGAERNPLDGDPEYDRLSESFYPTPPGERELAQESFYEYGSRVGVWRLLATLDRHGATATVFACGQALERNPAAAAAFVERGYDLVGHGHRWIAHHGLGDEAIRDEVRRATAAIERLTGQRIVGWFTRPPLTPATRRVLVEEGFLFDSDSFTDDVPYYVTVAGRSHLVVPYSLDVNDIRYWKGSLATGDDWLAYARDSFDALHAESAATPRLLSIGLHCRVIGRPGRIGALDRLLAHIRRHPDVWLCRRTDLARHWLAQYPPPQEAT